MVKIKIGLFMLMWLGIAPNINAQKIRPLYVSVLANGTVLPTQTNEIFHSVHPGITAGTAFRYNGSSKNQLAQTIKVGYNYHQFVHHSLQVYSELEYKKILGRRVTLASALGAGYVHLFSATEVFRKNDNGTYETKPNWGRPQIMGTSALAAGYLLNQSSLKPIEIFIRYQFWLQTPFVRQYVPILPNTALHLGLNYPLFAGK